MAAAAAAYARALAEAKRRAVSTLSVALILQDLEERIPWGAVRDSDGCDWALVRPACRFRLGVEGEHDGDDVREAEEEHREGRVDAVVAHAHGQVVGVADGAHPGEAERREEAHSQKQLVGAAAATPRGGVRLAALGDVRGVEQGVEDADHAAEEAHPEAAHVRPRRLLPAVGDAVPRTRAAVSLHEQKQIQMAQDDGCKSCQRERREEEEKKGASARPTIYSTFGQGFEAAHISKSSAHKRIPSGPSKNIFCV